MRARQPIVSIIVVVYGGGWEWLDSALTALRHETTEPWELVVVDNGPEDRVPAMFRGDFGATTVIRNNENVGFGVACNQAAAQARAEVLCFLNPDVFVCADWLPPLVRALETDPGTGAVVPQKLNRDRSLQEAGAFVDSEAHTCAFGFGGDPRLPEHRFPRDIDYGSASCVCLRRETFVQLGGFDPIYELGYFEDADLCFRLREHGLTTLYEPRSQVKHERTTAVPLETALRAGERNRLIFLERWKAALSGRPTCAQIAEDARCAIAARDLHTRERLLVLDSPHAARELRRSYARARITLASCELLDPGDREALLGGGVEVVERPDWEPWLESRRGHYSIVASNPGGATRDLRTLAIQANPRAAIRNLADVELGDERSAPLEWRVGKVGQTTDESETAAIPARRSFARGIRRTLAWPMRRFFDRRFAALAAAQTAALEQVAADLAARQSALFEQIAAARTEGETRASGSLTQHEATRKLIEDLQEQVADLSTKLAADMDATTEATAVLGAELSVVRGMVDNLSRGSDSAARRGT